MKRTVTLLALVLLWIPHMAYAGTTDDCRDRTNREVAREQRLYRAYLFGKPRAKDAAINTVRYDRKGRTWIKTDDPVPWRTSDPDNKGLHWSNSLMDKEDEHADIIPIKGIFETKRVTTSELIPYLLQTIRAFECRMAALCEIARYSEIQSGKEPVSMGAVQPLGCIEYTGLQTWPECHFGDPEEGMIDQVDERSYCTEISMQLLRREEELLKLAVEYDAGYRTLLQFAGNFDIFQEELQWPLSGTIRQAVQLMGQLERIPCFLSSCDASPPPQSN